MTELPRIGSDRQHGLKEIERIRHLWRRLAVKKTMAVAKFGGAG